VRKKIKQVELKNNMIILILILKYLVLIVLYNFNVD